MRADRNDGPLASRPFENLQRMISEKWRAPFSKKSGPQPAEAVSDDELFREAMRKVREIREFREIPVHSRRISPPVQKRRPEERALDILREIRDGRRQMDLPNTQEYVEWVNPDYAGTSPALLHEGVHSVQDCIDLHGLTVAEAEEEVARFLDESRKRQYRCIKIIHGRGLRSARGPVLKQALMEWLHGRFRKYVRAYVTARGCDGGLGAVYVLLSGR